jgi:hypothetical protein
MRDIASSMQFVNIFHLAIFFSQAIEIIMEEKSQRGYLWLGWHRESATRL